MSKKNKSTSHIHVYLYIKHKNIVPAASSQRYGTDLQKPDYCFIGTLFIIYR